MRKTITLFITMTMTAISMLAQTDNPFFREWKTPFGAPPFEQIRNDHYMPAFMEGMKQQQAEIEAIVSNPATPTFENTIAALDRSGALLDKVSSVFYGLNSANTNDAMQEIARRLSPLMSKHSDDISLNPGLYNRIKAVYKSPEMAKLAPDQRRLVEETYKGFVRSGANLRDEDKEKLRELNSEISMLQLTFGQNLLSETNAYKLILDREEYLEGLSKEQINSALEAGARSEATKGKWVFTLQNPSVMPFLQFSENRKYREQIFSAYISRGNNNNDKDNKAIIAKLIPLRKQKAALLGFDSYAAYALDDRMAKKPENVYNLLDQIWTPALEMARREAADMQSLIREEGQDFQLEGWDWRYYSNKIMQKKFDLNEEILKPYFKLDNVREGVFYVARKLYGITFTEVAGAPKYFTDVRLYECKEADGSHLGVLYLDFHPRASKRGGAWCGSYRSQKYENGKRVAPVMTIVCNFSAPSGDQPALLTPDEAETFFHEFGHALAGLMRNVRYDGISGVPRDFVELPSQIMEHWAFEPEVLKVYAKHYQTGAVIPAELVEKIQNSSKFGQGFKTTEYLAASYLDMDYHFRYPEIKAEGAVKEPATKPASEVPVFKVKTKEKSPEMVTSDREAPPAEEVREGEDIKKAEAVKEGEKFDEKNPLPGLDVLAFEAASMKRIGLIPQIPPRYRSTYFQHTMTGGYTAGYYSYIWAEVLDADAFQAFKEKGNIFDKATAQRFRTCILEKGGSKEAMEMYVDFRGHEPKIDALLENRGLKN